MTKRAFDLTFASIGLLVLAPLMAAIAIWVIVDSPGPALFRQQRVGRYGRPFAVIKFRTMRTDQGETSPLLTPRDDRRVTRAGRFLRRTKLDEFPQLINVIRGEMSLVGPRPEVAKYVALYPPGIRDVVLSVRPGITGLCRARLPQRVVADARPGGRRGDLRDVHPSSQARAVPAVRPRAAGDRYEDHPSDPREGHPSGIADDPASPGANLLTVPCAPTTGWAVPAGTLVRPRL